MRIKLFVFLSTKDLKSHHLKTN